ncbi:dienelactone hydrolase family protein [Burkholderia plantarii]|uniref:dienelactone hydrolase family protein n=1 Tax=Burkholderia plantarii TaxID=41899 RepID=UPI0018DECCCC|nr:dienelactone hydrolase family protein [Burkholderia plantarii]MBI0326668.1 dienelactone hydrolase family protein [Burkholderia plantarii]
MTSQWIDIPAGNETFGGYLALPKGGKGPAVVIVQEIFGVNGHIRSVAEQYAADGYVALAPDIFWRTQPRVDLGYEGADRDKGIELLQKTDPHQAAADIGHAVAALRARPEVEGNRVAGIGYCFGGRLVYLAAAAGSFDVAVAYYGGGIQNHLDVANHVTQPIQFHYAGLDDHIPAEAVAQVKAAFGGRTDVEVHEYPDADHGFNCNVRASYNQRAAALAHGRTLTFLAERL